MSKKPAKERQTHEIEPVTNRVEPPVPPRQGGQSVDPLPESVTSGQKIRRRGIVKHPVRAARIP